jgi:hypothetical protein
LAILGIEKIDLDGGGLSDSVNREREKNKDTEGNKKFLHFGPLWLIHSPKTPGQAFSLLNLLTY